MPQKRSPHSLLRYSSTWFYLRGSLHKVLPDAKILEVPHNPTCSSFAVSESSQSQKHGSSSMPSATEHQVVKALCILLFLCVTILSAPATNPVHSSTLSSLSALPAASEVSLAGYPHPLSLPTHVNKTNDPLSAIEHWVYSIPSTTLRLRIAAYPPTKIDRRALGQTILQAQTRVRRHIEKEGDGELWAEDDRMPHRPCAFPLCFPKAHKLRNLLQCRF